MIELLTLLVAGHCLADFGLQSDFMASMKRRVFLESMGFYALTAHAMIHGLTSAAVMGATGRAWFTVFWVVTITHWLIDFGKAWEGWARYLHKPKGWGLYGINGDQFLHLDILVLVASVTA